MKKKKLARTNEEFDRRFDEGEDIHDLLDLSKGIINKPGKKVRITLDIGRALVEEIDQIRQSIGVDRGALIKVWLHERVQREKERQNTIAER
ncbi:MAG: CopG family transcriptional regulator [Desulfobacterales bacterium]|nr:CopG family transcriptional regulator [Desulfobacterales bacterium]